MFFGNQNGAGQFHRSAYTSDKLRALATRMGFANVTIQQLDNKGGQVLRAELTR